MGETGKKIDYLYLDQVIMSLEKSKDLQSISKSRCRMFVKELPSDGR